MSVHAIFPRHLCALWKVIDLLVATECLIRLTFDVTAGPANQPLLVPITNLFEAVVLESVPDQMNVCVVVELEVVATVLWLVWSQGNGVYVRPKHQVLL